MSTLYLHHFGLGKEPFKMTPDLDFFFSGGLRGDVLTALLHVAGHEEGIITLVAEVGSGKTLLARIMISRLEPHICAVYLANPCFNRNEILGAIGRDLGLNDLPALSALRLAALHNELMRRHALGQRVVLVIDEAHAMPAQSLEEVRLLSNLETSQHKLINIMLFGQPELEELLADQQLRQVRDRIAHRFQLDPLSSQDVSAYVDHRLRAAGFRGSPLFSPSAMSLLAKASGGRARRINILADKALLSAYAQGLSSVYPVHVTDAIGELHEDFATSPSRSPWVKWAALGTGLMVCASLWVGWRWHLALPTQGSAPHTAPAPVLAAQPPAVVAPPPRVVASSVAPVIVHPPAPTSPTSSTSLAAASGWQIYLLRTHNHLNQANLSGYTLQLAALPRSENVSKYLQFVSQYADSATIFAQLSHYNGGDFVSVFVGHYATLAQARAALEQLPAAIKANHPLVRTWVKIKQDQS